MFGISDGFDIVIGNPPYVQLQKSGGKLAKLYEEQKFNTFARTGDIYSLFYEKAHQLLKQGGICNFITSNKWMRAGYGEATRKFFIENTNPLILIDFAGVESGTTIVLLGVLGYLVFFLMLYVQILTAFVKFYLVTGYAFILIPFGVFEKTKDIALKGLNGLFGQAIELFVLVVLLNLTEMFMDGPFNSTVGMKIDGYAAIKSSLFTKVGVLMFLFLMINKAGTIASALLSGAIASIGIGAEAGARGLNNAISAPGRLAGGLADKASDGKRDGVGGGKMFRDGSSAQNAYQNAASFIKGKFRKGGQSGGNSNNSSSSS